MIEYVHRPCGHVVAVLNRDTPIVPGEIINRYEWLIGGKKLISFQGLFCGKCQQKFYFGSKYMRPKIKD